MSQRSKRSIKAQRSLQRTYSKQKTAKNNKQKRNNFTRKSDHQLKVYKELIESQIDLRNLAVEKGDHEMYAHSNKILMLMILDLAAQGTKKAAKLANQYSERTGIKIDEKKLKERINALPTAKNTVKKIKNTANHPPPGSIAAGWVW
jgi:hypothetical protein